MQTLALYGIDEGYRSYALKASYILRAELKMAESVGPQTRYERHEHRKMTRKLKREYSTVRSQFGSGNENQPRELGSASSNRSFDSFERRRRSSLTSSFSNRQSFSRKPVQLSAKIKANPFVMGNLKRGLKLSRTRTRTGRHRHQPALFEEPENTADSAGKDKGLSNRLRKVYDDATPPSYENKKKEETAESHNKPTKKIKSQRGRCCPRVNASFAERVFSWRYYVSQRILLVMPMIMSLMGSFLMFSFRNQILYGLAIASSLETLESNDRLASPSPSLSSGEPEVEPEPLSDTIGEMFLPKMQVNAAAALEINEPMAAYLGVTGLAFGLIYAFVFQRAYTRHDEIGQLLHSEIASLNEVISFIHLTEHFEAEIRARLLSNVQKFALDLRIQIMSASYDARSKRGKDVFSRIVPDLRALMAAHARLELEEHQLEEENLIADVEEEIEILNDLDREESEILRVSNLSQKQINQNTSSNGSNTKRNLEEKDVDDENLKGEATESGKEKDGTNSSSPASLQRYDSTSSSVQTAASKFLSRLKSNRLHPRFGLTRSISRRPIHNSSVQRMSNLSAASVQSFQDAKEAIEKEAEETAANIENTQAEIDRKNKIFEREQIEGANFDRAVLEGIIDVLHTIEQAQYERWYWMDKRIPFILWVLIWVTELSMFMGILLLQTGRASLDAMLCWVSVVFLAVMLYILSDVDHINVGLMRIGVKNLDAMFMIDDDTDVDVDFDASDIVEEEDDDHIDPERSEMVNVNHSTKGYFRSVDECYGDPDSTANSDVEEKKSNLSKVKQILGKLKVAWRSFTTMAPETSSPPRSRMSAKNASSLKRVTSTTRPDAYRLLGWKQGTTKESLIKSTRTLSVDAFKGHSFNKKDILAKKMRQGSKYSVGKKEPEV